MIDTNGVVITRVFDTSKSNLFTAWTVPELVTRWWGPEGFTAPSIKIDLRPGGRYIFCMRGPAGTQFDTNIYSAGEYKEIVPNEKLVVTDYFSDAEGNKISPVAEGLPSDMPSEMNMVVTFADEPAGKSRLTITYLGPLSEAQVAAMKKSQMEDGWSSSLNKLSRVLISR